MKAIPIKKIISKKIFIIALITIILLAAILLLKLTKSNTPTASTTPDENTKIQNITVQSTLLQKMHFGADLERLWYWNNNWSDAFKDKISKYTVEDIKLEYLRVAIVCGYEREEGVKNLAAYDKTIDMMKTMKSKNPNIKFFATPQPLDEAYTADEEKEIWGGKCPWAPYPDWVIHFERDGVNSDKTYKWKITNIYPEKLTRYYADYLNLMNSYGFKIDYIDLTNEKNDVTPEIAKYLKDNIKGLLNDGVSMPLLIGPSAWSYDQAAEWLNSAPSLLIDIASGHNTGGGNSPINLINAANKKNIEVWNTELHTWVGVDDKKTEINNSLALFESIRSGISGIDTWLFLGPYSGKDHTMLYAGSDESKGVRTSLKYEIFKKMVNTANGSNYMKIDVPYGITKSLAFIKDNTITIWLLNSKDSDSEKLCVNIDNKKIRSNNITQTIWKYDDADNFGKVYSINKSSDNSFITEPIPKYSICCYEFEIK